MGLVVKDVRRHWPGGCIVFKFGTTLSKDESDLFKDAMKHWKTNADVRFVERTTQDAFVTFMPDPVPEDSVNHSSALAWLAATVYTPRSNLSQKCTHHDMNWDMH